MTLNELVEEFLLYLSAVRNVSENTVAGYRNDLTQLQVMLTPELDVKSVTKENLLLCIGELSRQKTDLSRHSELFSVMRESLNISRKTLP